MPTMFLCNCQRPMTRRLRDPTISTPSWPRNQRFSCASTTSSGPSDLPMSCNLVPLRSICMLPLRFGALTRCRCLCTPMRARAMRLVSRSPPHPRRRHLPLLVRRHRRPVRCQRHRKSRPVVAGGSIASRHLPAPRRHLSRRHSHRRRFRRSRRLRQRCATGRRQIRSSSAARRPSAAMYSNCSTRCATSTTSTASIDRASRLS